jgi:TonB family protein
MGSPRSVLMPLLLLVSLASGAPAQQGASIFGVVRDSAGRPVMDAEVGVLGAATRARTDLAGQYRIASLAPGRAAVVARRLGFRSESRQLRLAEGDQRRVDFVLVAVAQQLEAQAVVAKGEAYESRLAGFNERRQKRVGHFVTRERIDRANSATFVDVLREVPGLRVGGHAMVGRFVRIRSSTCPPLVFIDGFPASAGEFDLDMIDVQSVEGVEVYSGLGSTPPEFTGPRELQRCGVIAIWSRPMRSRVTAPRAEAVPSPRGPVVVVAGATEPYTRDEVDQPALPEAGTLAPVYPESLFLARTAGRVVMEFVVDTTGQVEPGTIEVLEASDTRFGDAVRSALARALFRPAIRGGHRVRQYVQLPFAFTLEGAVPASRSPTP